jgi:hypothetical protein
MLEAWKKIQKSPEYWDYDAQDRAIIKAQWFKNTIGNTPEFQSYNKIDKAAILNAFSRYGDDVSPERTFWGTLGDIGITTAKGIVGLGESAVGIADIPTLGLVGKAMEKGLGYDPKLTREVLETGYSPAQKAAQHRVGRAEGFIETAKEMLKSPSTIAHGALESAPLMLGGASIARKLIAKGVSIPVALGAGEGAVSAGIQAEQIRQETPEGLLSAKQTGQS